MHHPYSRGDQTFLRSAGLDRHGSLPARGVQSTDGHQILSVWLQSSEHSGVAVAIHRHGAYVSAGKRCILHPVPLDALGLQRAPADLNLLRARVQHGDHSWTQ